MFVGSVLGEPPLAPNPTPTEAPMPIEPPTDAPNETLAEMLAIS
jgi:hypothetical protein